MPPEAAADAQVGIGLRQPHYAQVLAQRPALGFVEVHSENFFADGGAALGLLDAVRGHYAVSLHGVGLSLGAATGLDPWHLDRLARLAQRVQPVRISDHAAFARAPVVPGGPVLHANDLLPIAFTPASLDIMVCNVGEAQERLRRSILVENLSAYVGFDDGAGQMAEVEFLVALARRSGCGLLLDVNNLMVNAVNAQADDPVATCCAFVDAVPPEIVGEIHLAGYCDETDFGIAIDDHGSRVREAVWQIYGHALRRLDRVPTLVEWDTALPALEVLLGEADTAAQWQARSCR